MRTVCLTLSLLFAAAVFCPAADLPVKPEIFAKSAILVDARSGRVLFEKNADERRAVASTQKLLTGLLIAGGGALNKQMVIEASDTKVEPTVIGLKAGESYTRIELLRALLVKSGNDTAAALARDNAGSVAAFAGKMNRKAWELGAYNSKFVNPNGLPAKGQYSTARDMAKVSLACWRSAVIRSIITIRYLPFRHADGKIVKLKNTNRVLHNFPYCNGMKTGYTNAAGHCLISSGTNNGYSVIAVVLGSNKANVWNDSHSLLVYGLNTLMATAPAPTPQP